MRGSAPTLTLLLAVAVCSAVPANAADRIGQKSNTVTALGARLAPFSGRHRQPLNRDAFWSDVRRAIEASNAATDAASDSAAGHTGLMTHANDAAIEPRLAPGLKCYDRSEPARRAVFLFSYSGPLTEAAGGALLAFDIYARGYNRAVLSGSAFGETSCRTVGW